MKTRFFALIVVVVAVALSFYAKTTTKPFYKLGLDLNGGTHLVFQADVSKIAPSEVSNAMQSLRDVIEKRINVFGVSEPLVQVEEANTGSEKIEKLVVELPGVSDVNRAVAIIGQTPSLEFKLTSPAPVSASSTSASSTSEQVQLVSTGLTGQYLKTAQVQFDPQTNQPVISLTFNDEGKELFANITRNNIGKPLAIVLDGEIIEAPVIRDEIRTGTAQISGGFTLPAAKELVRNLNFGALPVPVTLIGTQTIGASLGSDALHDSVKAGIIGFVIIALFLIVCYRIPGLIATISLVLYVILNLSIFKLIPVTLTSAGLAGFILSIGMAVDANILIFERMKEEFRAGLPMSKAIREGFSRAWTSIRDGNLSSIITAVILFWFATTALVKGFALVFGIGVLTSMFTAIVVSRTFLLALAPGDSASWFVKFLFGAPYKNDYQPTGNTNKK